MRSLQEIAADLYRLAEHYTLECRMEVHDVNRLISIADEVDQWAVKLEDDCR